MLNNTPNRPSKFRIKNWVEMNDDARRTYNIKSQIKFKISMLESSLCDYSDAYILVPCSMLHIYAPFTDCTSERNNSQIDNAKDIGIVMPMYNLIEYSNSY